MVDEYPGSQKKVADQIAGVSEDRMYPSSEVVVKVVVGIQAAKREKENVSMLSIYDNGQEGQEGKGDSTRSKSVTSGNLLARRGRRRRRSSR